MPTRNDTAPERAERIARLAWFIAHGGRVTTAYIRRQFRVSKATAKRDVGLLNRVLCGMEAERGPQQPRELSKPGARPIMLMGADTP